MTSYILLILIAGTGSLDGVTNIDKFQTLAQCESQAIQAKKDFKKLLSIENHHWAKTEHTCLKIHKSI